MENGRNRPYEGYCTDIFTDHAISFIERHRADPFFLYLPTNAPHVPLIVEESYTAPYRAMGLADPVAKLYGMIANLDENIGRLLDALDRLGLRDNTIVVFMTDNGAQIPAEAQRYNAGMRGEKGTVYEGGIRVPCFVRWPGITRPGTDVDRIAAHIDITPTLLEACGIAKPAGVRLDGRSLIPLLRGQSGEWSDRTLFFQWHRGDRPELHRNCGARTQRYKLVNGIELYDLEKDPAESRDVAKDHPDIVSQLRGEYERWFADVSATRGYDPPRIVLGDSRANPVNLTQQDQRGIEVDQGHWQVQVAAAGTYEAVVRFPKASSPGEAHLTVGDIEAEVPIPAGKDIATFSNLSLPAGPARLRCWVHEPVPVNSAHYVDVNRTGPG
jgi:arylsulfatase A-like enzyme